MPKLPGLKIQKIEVFNPKSFSGNPNKKKRKTILNIERKAKMLGINLDRNLTLLIHLKMSGQLILIQNSKLKRLNLGVEVRTFVQLVKT